MFVSDLKMETLTPDLWAVTSPLIWVEHNEVITVPIGFITDLASIPHVVDWVPFLDRTGLSRKPAVLHDALYALGRERGKDYADQMLRAALQVEGLANWEAALYYRAVHWFGNLSYAKDAPGPTWNYQNRFVDGEGMAWIKAGGSLFSSLPLTITRP